MSGISRRNLISGGAVAAVAAATPGATARNYSGKVPWSPGAANRPQEVSEAGYLFFSADEVRFIDAVVARLIPADELGPGAKEAGVTLFLDRQLAGPYGRAQTWYMQGPWKDGEETQGYQSRLTPAQLYREAIRNIETHCQKKYGGTFDRLRNEEQDNILTDLEMGKIELQLGNRPIQIAGVSSDGFFAQLMQNTIEGFFSDPLYGGNKDMIGWKLIGFPGARYDYRPYISQHNTKLNLEPVGIKGRPGWKPG